MSAYNNNVHPFGPFPIPGGVLPDGSSVGRNGDPLSRRHWSVPFVVMRKLYLAGLRRLWSFACVPLCRESCLADMFAYHVNVLPRYDGWSNSHGSFRTLSSKVSPAGTIPDTICEIHQAHIIRRIDENSLDGRPGESRQNFVAIALDDFVARW